MPHHTRLLSPQEDDTFGKLFTRVDNAVKKGLKSNQQKIAALEQQLKDTELAGSVQKEGDLIIANLYR